MDDETAEFPPTRLQLAPRTDGIGNGGDRTERDVEAGFDPREVAFEDTLRVRHEQ